MTAPGNNEITVKGGNKQEKEDGINSKTDEKRK